MKQTITGPSMPMAAICINKSRLKTYHKEKQPTFYLEKGQEFQIELYNPTSDTILAKIQLNGNQISQGGLILRPGERVFLERYLDVAKKFMFDTYEVANTAEVQKAIEDNGDFKVDFYRESKQLYSHGGVITIKSYPSTLTIDPYQYDPYQYDYKSLSGTLNSTSQNINIEFNGTSHIAGKTSLYSSNVTMDNLNISNNESATKSLRSSAKKTIETGRVEAGSSSNQKLEYVSKSFEYWPFHSVEYKLLPVSQKINTITDINIKRYCHVCGAKQKPEFKFCPSCGTKA